VSGHFPERRAVVAAVAEKIPAARGPDCVRVGIDGVDGAGKTMFAEALGSHLRACGRSVVRVGVDDFHHPRGVRYRRGRHSPEGYWLESFDYPRLRADVLTPLGPGGSRHYRAAAHDLRTDAVLDPPWQTAPTGAVLLLDGVFLHRDELHGCWDLSIWLDVPLEIATERTARRDDTAADTIHPSLRRYVRGQQLYLAACSPRRRADVVIDNSDVERPRIVEC
jgi:uridine kinase